MPELEDALENLEDEYESREGEDESSSETEAREDVDEILNQ